VIEDYEIDQLAPVHEMGEAIRPPHLYPVAAEHACVGIVLLRGVKAMDTLRGMLRKDDFCDQRCRAAYAALFDLDEEGDLPASDSVSLVAVMSAIRANGDSAMFPQGQEQIHGLFLRDEPAFGGEDGAEVAGRLVAGSARLRLAAETADAAARSIRTRPDLARPQAGREFLDGVSTGFADLASRTVSDEPAVHISIVADEHDRVMADRLEGSAAVVWTRIGSLDHLLDGVDADAGDLVVIAGRPSMGKTALAQAIAQGQCVEERSPGSSLGMKPRPWVETWRPLETAIPVLWASAEMSEVQLMDRTVANMVTINSRRIQRPVRRETREQDLQRWRSIAPLVKSAKQFVRTWPVSYVEKPRILEEIERTAKSWRHAHPIVGKDSRGRDRKGPAMLLVDHLGEISMIGGRPKGMREDQYFGTIGRRLKALGKDLGIVVVLLMQLSRKVESRDNKRPMLSDLREAGVIEELADTALFCFRPPYYGVGDHSEEELWSRYWNLRQNNAQQDEIDRVLSQATAMEIIARKARQGSVGTAKAAFLRAFTRVTDAPRGM